MHNPRSAHSHHSPPRAQNFEPLELDTTLPCEDVHILRRSQIAKRVAVAMATHHRVGADSPMRVLPPEILTKIVDGVGVPGFVLVAGMYRLFACQGVRFCPTAPARNGGLDVLGCYQLPSLPRQRSGHGSVFVDGAVYVLGGFGHPYSLNSCHMLSLKHNSRWLPAAEMSTARHGGFACQNVGRMIVVAGGRTTTARGQPTPTAELFHTSINLWTPLPSMSVARYGCSHATVCGGMLVVSGSNDSGNIASCEFLDLRQGRWQTTAPLSAPVYGSTATAIDEHTVVVCGGATSYDDASRDVLLCDMRKPEWRAVATLHSPRVCSTSMQTSTSTVMVCGGKNDPIGCEIVDVVSGGVTHSNVTVPLWHHTLVPALLM